MASYRYNTVDVFTATPLKGNALAVVHDATGLSDAAMQKFAHWTNLSETTFLLPPTNSQADYRVRIFFPSAELPFAGHPTLGSCHAWLAAGGKPRSRDEIVQECGVGLVRVRRDGLRLAFAAPPLRRSGDVDAPTLAAITQSLGIDRKAIRASQWVDNGPGWVAIMLGSRDELLALKPDFARLTPKDIGVVAPMPPGSETQFEMRAFIGGAGPNEDPVTGSLQAGLAQWMIGAGMAPERYVATQGTVLGRDGRVYVEKRGNDVWIGGDSVTLVEGKVQL
ncbi:MAG TPA: PhzF family phenazine biosynthesis protein [Gammaproteobacteria bacterium]|jgi:PhzF family phenazine biosynthesis protein|nr:PhzF family phenazine biosynthesis protein [Gammaproteobacteria bacterium]